MNYFNLLQLGIQQCFGVVYDELTTLRRVYFAPELPEQNKAVLALLIHDIPLRNIFDSFSTTIKQSCYILLSDFQKKAKPSVGYHELTKLCACTKRNQGVVE